jgi:hypothetical protein
MGCAYWTSIESYKHFVPNGIWRPSQSSENPRGLNSSGAHELRDKLRTEGIMATELTGKVVNGVVALYQPGRLADGTTVRVQPLDNNEEARGKDINSLREMLLSHAGVIEDTSLPTDLAENLDHYLYRTPKKTGMIADRS